MTSEIKPANKDETETEEPTLFDKSAAAIDDPTDLVLHNAKGVAEYFGKSLRTIQDWMAGGMSQFCTPATPGKSDGNFPVAEIIKWRKKIEKEITGPVPVSSSQKEITGPVPVSSSCPCFFFSVSSSSVSSS